MPISINQQVSFNDPALNAINGLVTGSGKKKISSVSVFADDQLINSNALTLEGNLLRATVSFKDNETGNCQSSCDILETVQRMLQVCFLLLIFPLDDQYGEAFSRRVLRGFAGSVNGQHGRSLYTVTTVLDSNQQKQFIDAIGQGRRTYRVCRHYRGGVRSRRSCFRPAGPNHDTLNLSDTSLQRSAQVLHHTSMSGGDATIHIAPNESVTLTGVSKAQLANHPGDFVFTGGHALAPAT